MEKTNTYTCPICGKTYSGLKFFSECVNSHVAEETKKEIEQRAAEKQAKIAKLRTENEELVSRIQRNNKQLRELGVTAVLHYGEVKEPIHNTEDTLDKTLNDLIKDIANLL